MRPRASANLGLPEPELRPWANWPQEQQGFSINPHRLLSRVYLGKRVRKLRGKARFLALVRTGMQAAGDQPGGCPLPAKPTSGGVKTLRARTVAQICDTAQRSRAAPKSGTPYKPQRHGAAEPQPKAGRINRGIHQIRGKQTPSRSDFRVFRIPRFRMRLCRAGFIASLRSRIASENVRQTRRFREILTECHSAPRLSAAKPSSVCA